MRVAPVSPGSTGRACDGPWLRRLRTFDGRGVTAALRRLGIQVTTELGPDRLELTEALRAFAQRSAGANVSLFLYARYGIRVRTASTTSSRSMLAWTATCMSAFERHGRRPAGVDHGRVVAGDRVEAVPW